MGLALSTAETTSSHKRQRFDLESWAKALKLSARRIAICVIGFFLAWLIFWKLAPWLNEEGATSLYNVTTNNLALVTIYGIATLGDIIWVPLVFYLYVFRRDTQDWTSSLVLAVAMVAAMALTDILKTAFNLPRPFTVIPGITPRYQMPTSPGLPSGHTTNAFTVATVVWARYPEWRIPFALLGVATGLSMVILGLHYPSDVIAGSFLGIFSGTFAVRLAELRSNT